MLYLCFTYALLMLYLCFTYAYLLLDVGLKLDALRTELAHLTLIHLLVCAPYLRQ